MKLNQPKKSKVSLSKFIRALFQKETPTYIKAVIGLALAYTVFPIDVLPDILGPIGFADDAAILGLLTTVAMKLLDNHQEKNRVEQAHQRVDVTPND